MDMDNVERKNMVNELLGSCMIVSSSNKPEILLTQYFDLQLHQTLSPPEKATYW